MTTQELIKGLTFLNPLPEWENFPYGTWKIGTSQRFGGNPDHYKSIKYSSADKKWPGRSIDGHNGWDIAAPRMTVVKAMLPGQVEWVGTDSLGGQGVKIRSLHPFYNDYWIEHIYWHHAEMWVSKGNWVDENRAIAGVNSTGFSTGNHLHCAVRFANRFAEENNTAAAAWWRQVVDYYNGYFGYVDFIPQVIGRTMTNSKFTWNGENEFGVALPKMNEDALIDMAKNLGLSVPMQGNNINFEELKKISWRISPPQ